MTTSADGLWRWVYYLWRGARWHLTSDGMRTFCSGDLPSDSETKAIGTWVPSRAARCEDCIRQATDWLGL